jgi:hypothetical protein
MRLICGRHLRRDSVANALQRREHAQEGECTGVHHFLIVDQHGQLAIVSIHETDVDAELFLQESRRTDGLNG